VAGEVNMPALRMAANLVGRRIAPAVSRAQTELPPPTFEAPPQRSERRALAPSPMPPAGAPASSSAPGRRFRGRPLD
jgi:hypothetical protein